MNATHLRIISCPREGGEMTGYNPDQQPKCRLTEALSEMTGDARRTIAAPSPAPHSRHCELRVAGGEAGKQGVTEAGKQEGTQASCPEPAGTHAPRYAYRGLRLAISERQDWLLSEAFPWVERQAEYRKMESWLEANPLRRPRNTSRFAHNWFSKIDAPTSSSAAPEGLSANSSHKEFTTGGSPQGLTTGGHSQVRTALSEARVGMGPQGPVRVKPEYWEKLRQREEAMRTNAPKSFREARNSDNIKT